MDGPQSTQAGQMQLEPRFVAQPTPSPSEPSTARSPIIILFYSSDSNMIIVVLTYFLSLASDR
jgi:hypothetical protein